MLIGYARGSTGDQTLDVQTDALKPACADGFAMRPGSKHLLPSHGKYLAPAHLRDLPPHRKLSLGGTRDGTRLFEALIGVHMPNGVILRQHRHHDSTVNRLARRLPELRTQGHAMGACYRGTCVTNSNPAWHRHRGSGSRGTRASNGPVQTCSRRIRWTCLSYYVRICDSVYCAMRHDLPFWELNAPYTSRR